ncbi:MAG TPA: FtsK/SpoIIIE domain-containing protein [Candidatus Acidoferrum sp.]|nr:FtsK/SpoIIIE domain-containing protein [Candidatus Acidoferrum sp.]
MSNILGVGKTLELVEGLRATVRDIAGRAEKLNQELAARSNQERRQRERAAAAHAAELESALAEAQAGFTAAREAATARFDQRKDRVGKAYQSSKDKCLQRVEEETGAHKYELQKRMLQAERDRDAGYANTATALQDFKASLAGEDQALTQLESEVHSAFKGYRSLSRLLAGAAAKAQAASTKDENQMLAALRDSLEKTRADLRRFRRHLVLRLFKYWAGWLIIFLCLVPLIFQHWGYNRASQWKAAWAVLAGVVVLFGARYLSRRQALPLATAIAEGLGNARRLHDAAFARSDAHYAEEVERIKTEFETTTRTVDLELRKTVARAGERRVACRMASDGKAFRALERNERLYRARLQKLEREHADAADQLKRTAEVRRKAEAEASAGREQKFTAEHKAHWQELEAEWRRRIEPVYASVAAANAAAEKLFPPWQPPLLQSWAPPKQFSAAARFGQLEVDVDELSDLHGRDKHPALPGPPKFSAPLTLVYPEQGSLLFEAGGAKRAEAIGALNNVILRLLATSPPGRLNFTIIDPVGLGQNFAGIMHLADYEEQIINSRIWTQSVQIEQKLADLNEHMEKVIQMYLRNEYATIAEYNEQAGVIAEKYYFLVIADFPANFTDVAAKRLLSIANSGSRCGVYTLIHWDQRHPLPADFIPEELRKSSVCVTVKDGQFVIPPKPQPGTQPGRDASPRRPQSAQHSGAGHSGRLGEAALPGTRLLLDAPPTPEYAIEFVQRVGQSSRDSSRVEVPFEHVAPPEPEIWSEETTGELRVPIGRTGATKFQYLAIGKGTCQHGLIAGKTGSGKSTLFHVIITNLALWCSPEQVEFYLVDFKKGVEFKCYAANRLPHARVVAIESDREFGLSVLQRVDDELKRRGDLFRKLGVQDLAGYKRAGGKEKLPRSLLMIDEFQEFFVEDDKVAQTASLLLDRIVRQGRAFGIHVLLGSQTLGGAYTVARTTLGQMVIRIALQCNEADAYLIMDDNNPAPRLLSRPGEGIYNDMAGMLEGNSPFQTVWLPDQVRDGYLKKVRALADQEEIRNPKAEGRGAETDGEPRYPGPIVFEGNAPADVKENGVLQRLLNAKALKPAVAGRIWLGAPNSIKGPTEAVFNRQSGNNLLIVGQREETSLALLTIGLVSLAAQYPLGKARFILCDSTPPGTPQRDFIERVLQAIPHPVKLARQGELPELMKDLSAEMKERGEAPDPEAAPPVFLFIHDVQKYTKLRFEEEFGFSTPDPDAPPNPGVLLNDLVCEGTRLGFHVIATCDTYNNVNRYLSRKAFSEFEMRVLFQMSASDSASLIDSPKASLLGLHRALYYNQQEGYLETFRPYALPGNDWVEQVAANLARLLK